MPEIITSSLFSKRNALADRLTMLSKTCWDHGRRLSRLTLKKLFEKLGEAYHDWNSALPGYLPHDPALGEPFKTTDDMRQAFQKAVSIRESLRAEMIALQEEMDWLVYAAYGLISPADTTERVPPTSCDLSEGTAPSGPHCACPVPPITREQRPFVLWAQADGDFEKAVGLIPADWPKERRDLWRARLEAIRDNEHIRRIEQPVYKRRWDEQWKVGNRWQCGPIAYDAELVDAFDWWLSEKAEYWLEKKKAGGPVDLDAWAAALWADARVQAAWPVVKEALERLDRRADFTRYFAVLMKGQSVPENIPFAVPWEKIKVPVPASAKRIRGKLNVPRERFRVTEEGEFKWAGA